MSAQVSNEYVKIPFSDLALYPNNPRKDLGDIKALAGSIIGAGGVLTALTGIVRDGLFLATDGQRRFAALQMIHDAGGNENILQNIPFHILSGDQSEVRIAYNQMLSAEGEPLKPLELAEQIKTLIDEWEIKPIEIADNLGKSKAYIYELKRIADLPDYVKAAINAGNFSVTLIREHMKAGTLDDFLAKVNLNFEEGEGGEDVESSVVGTKGKITAKDLNKKNSVRDFKRFRKVFSQIFPSDELRLKFEFLCDFVDNNFSYEDFITMFTDSKTIGQAFKSDFSDLQQDDEKQDSIGENEKPKPKKARQVKSIAEKAAESEKTVTPETAKPKKATAKKAAVPEAKEPVKAVVPKKAAKAAVEAEKNKKTGKKDTGRVIGFDKKTGKAKS